MRSRPIAGAPDLDRLIAFACEPGLPARQLAEVRELIGRECGPAADAVLRLCDRTAAAERDRAGFEEQIERFLSGPRLRAIVTGLYDGRVRVAVAGAERELLRPAAMELAVGQTVLTDVEGRAVLGAGGPLIGGHTFVFCERLDDGLVLLRSLADGPLDEARQLGVVADAVDQAALAPGDRVIGWSIEGGNLVLVTRRLGPARLASVADDARPSGCARREDLFGLDEILERLDLLFLAPVSPAYARLHARTEGALVGYCFQGPTGCGKSRVARVLADEVRARGGRAIERTASSYLTKWVGEGAATLRADFDALDAAWVAAGVRPLLIIDEIEAIALDRRGAPGANVPGYLDVLDTLLHALTRTHARVIGISNVADRAVDTALQRDGRLPLLRFPGTLAAEAVAGLVARCLAGVSLDAGTPDDFGHLLSDAIFSPGGPLLELLRAQLSDGRVLLFGARDLASGAAIADGIVRPTLARGLQRDLRAGRPDPLPLAADELRAATVRYFRERAATITRDSIRSVLADRIPDDLAVVKVECLVAGRD
jgi:hypothetical protein